MLFRFASPTLLCLGLFLATLAVADDAGHFPDRPSQRFAGNCRLCKENGRPCQPTAFADVHVLEPDDHVHGSGQIWHDAEQRFTAIFVNTASGTSGKLLNSRAKRWTHTRYEVALKDRAKTILIFLLENNDSCHFDIKGQAIASIVAYITKEY